MVGRIAPVQTPKSSGTPSLQPLFRAKKGTPGQPHVCSMSEHPGPLSSSIHFNHPEIAEAQCTLITFGLSVHLHAAAMLEALSPMMHRRVMAAFLVSDVRFADRGRHQGEVWNSKNTGSVVPALGARSRAISFIQGAEASERTAGGAMVLVEWHTADPIPVLC